MFRAKRGTLTHRSSALLSLCSEIHLYCASAQASHFFLRADEDAARMLAALKVEYASDAEYQAALKRYGVTESEVAQYLLSGYRTLRFTDLRFRPEVELSDADLRDYYTTLVEKWRKQGETKIPAYETAHDDIEKLLTKERTDQALDRWLGAQRTQTQILYREQVFQ